MSLLIGMIVASIIVFHPDWLKAFGKVIAIGAVGFLIFVTAISPLLLVLSLLWGEGSDEDMAMIVLGLGAFTIVDIIFCIYFCIYKIRKWIAKRKQDKDSKKENPIEETTTDR